MTDNFVFLGEPPLRSVLFMGNVPFLLAERGCSNREEYFKTAQTDFQLFANCVRRCPLFAKLRFANSPLVALIRYEVCRPLRRAT